jgi:hypothetical protein
MVGEAAKVVKACVAESAFVKMRLQVLYGKCPVKGIVVVMFVLNVVV